MKRHRVQYSNRNENSHLELIRAHKKIVMFSLTANKQNIPQHYKSSDQCYSIFELPIPHIHNLSQSAIDYNLIELKFIEIIGHWFTIHARATMGLFIYLITLSLRLQLLCYSVYGYKLYGSYIKAPSMRSLIPNFE